MFLALLAPVTAQAHPRAFVEAEEVFVFDDQGLAGIHQKRHMATMLTACILDLIQKTDSGPLTEAERKAIEQQNFKLPKEYNLFTHILIDGEPFHVSWATDSKVTMADRNMIYDIVVPCRVEAGAADHTIAAGGTIWTIVPERSARLTACFPWPFFLPMPATGGLLLAGSLLG